jgi:malonate decarboxylase gamma subunit
MTLDEVLASLFPSGHSVERGLSGTLHGAAKIDGQGEVMVNGVVEGTALGVDGAILLASHVLAAVEAGGRTPIVVLVDTASQNMARRDELLGLNEYLAHLLKSLTLAAVHGFCASGLPVRGDRDHVAGVAPGAVAAAARAHRVHAGALRAVLLDAAPSLRLGIE